MVVLAMLALSKENYSNSAINKMLLNPLFSIFKATIDNISKRNGRKNTKVWRQWKRLIRIRIQKQIMPSRFYES